MFIYYEWEDQSGRERKCCWKWKVNCQLACRRVSHAHTHIQSQTFQVLLCNFIFQLPVYGIPHKHFRESLLSLSLHLSLFLYCCVAPGHTVMCPPSVPPSLSLSLCPCHLQLLCETRHTAWGREGGREGETEGGWEGRKRGKRRRDRQLYRQTEEINIWHHVKRAEKSQVSWVVLICTIQPKTHKSQIMWCWNQQKGKICFLHVPIYPI